MMQMIFIMVGKSMQKLSLTNRAMLVNFVRQHS